MTKLIGRSRGLWPSDGGVTGKASTPGIPMNFGNNSLAISGERRVRSLQSVRPTKDCLLYPSRCVQETGVDSAQVFRDMDIGTAKPDRATLARYPHRLIDLISPEESYSAARFRADALVAMAEITAAGKVPVLVGGTMLYFRALLNGLADLPQADATLRGEIDAEAAALGWPAMHAKLALLDPSTAARLQPGDSQRLQRALEVCRLSGRPMSELLAESEQQQAPYDLSLIHI